MGKEGQMVRLLSPQNPVSLIKKELEFLSIQIHLSKIFMAVLIYNMNTDKGQMEIIIIHIMLPQMVQTPEAQVLLGAQDLMGKNIFSMIQLRIHKLLKERLGCLM